MDDLIEPLVILARHNIPVDVQELLVQGNPDRGVPPGALAAALRAYAEREKELVEALDDLSETLILAFPTLANQPPVARARSILARHKEQT